MNTLKDKQEVQETVGVYWLINKLIKALLILMFN